MSLDKLTPNDSRINHGYAEINGNRWHYLDIAAQGSQRGTVFLIHGFPDLSLAWRYQIPLLSSLGLRCIALDCMGYGDTGVSPSLKDYTYKSHADAIAHIAKSIGADRIILGGHDWGGFVVYRTAQWYPELISHVSSVATPWGGVSDEYVPTEALVKGPLPQFGYQLQFGSEDHRVESVVKQDETKVRKFLTGLYGGKPESGKPFMTPEHGVELPMLTNNEEFAMTPLLTDEEFDFYTTQFTKTGLKGACNWYRTRKLNWEDEQNMPEQNKRGLQQPVLFIQCLYDSILKPEMSVGMEKAIPNLTRGEVKASHWGLWHTPVETNKLIKDWVEGVVLGGKSKL